MAKLLVTRNPTTTSTTGKTTILFGIVHILDPPFMSMGAGDPGSPPRLLT